jgi:hypothetical protein
MIAEQDIHSRVYDTLTKVKTGSLYGDVTIAGEELKNLGLRSVLRAFEQEGIFICFPVSSKGLLHFSSLLRHTSGWGGTILTRILRGASLYMTI